MLLFTRDLSFTVVQGDELLQFSRLAQLPMHPPRTALGSEAPSYVSVPRHSVDKYVRLAREAGITVAGDVEIG